MMKKMRLCIAVLLVLFMLGVPEKAEAATASQVEACTQELLEMLYTADLSRHDISRYGITKTEFLDILEEVRYGEGAEIEGAYFPSMSINYTSRNDYMRAVWLLDVNEDAVERYNQMQPIIESILAGVEADMTDLDKLIYLHGEVVDWVTYQQTTEAMYTASGAFIDKKAVCAGYAKALNILLHRVGIDATYVKGTSLNHGWSYVELDGQWYHVDPTWDDTRASAKGQISRNDLLRNDAEFSEDHGIWTVKRIDEASNSTLYKDWFVHDIVGEMSFEDGVWYYLDTKNKLVMAADVNEGTKEAVFNYSSLGTVVLVDAVHDGLVLRVNGRETCQTAEQWKVSTEGKQEESSNNEAIVTYALDFSDISLWRTGHYISTGSYALNKNRICLNELIENTQGQYKVSISDANYRITVRELNERTKIIASADLGDGDTYVPTEGTVYLAISIYNGALEKGMLFSTYESMFANGFSVGFNTESGGDVTEDVIGGAEEEIEDSIGGTEEVEDIPEDTGISSNVFGLNLGELSNWRTGHYISTGSYALNKNRICLNELVENTQSQYKVSISDARYRITVRELNERRKIIASADLGDGDIYVPTEGTVYLAISIYNGVLEKGIVFSTYESMFANGFSVKFTTESTGDVTEDTIGGVEEEIENNIGGTEEVEDTTEDNSGAINVFGLDLGEFSNWRTGHYISTGSYAQNRNRICLNELVENTQKKYIIAISDANYRVTVRELNVRRKIIASADLGDGDIYVPTEGTVYLAISVYNSVMEKGLLFSTYETLFEDGFEVGFSVVESATVIPDKGGIIGSINTILGVQSPNVSLAPSVESLVPLREVFYNILINGDTSIHDVSAYGLTYFEFEDIWEDVIANEGYIAFEAWGGVFPQVTKDANGIVLTTKMYDLAGGDVRARYEKVMSCIEEVKVVAQGMSELDKVLYVYEYVMSNTTYSKNGYLTAYSGGALGNGLAKCEGYARACMLLLRELGIECYRISSTDMNHSWTYVKVNGEWYHLDATWDDADVVKHVYLLRNAEEFDSMPERHYNWNYVTDEILPESTSKELVSWFVHDVTGQMFYENGMWYYTDSDTGAIVRSDIFGNNCEVLVENTANGLLITGVTDGQVSYREK